MKVIEKDPRVPLRPYLLDPERETDMDRQVDEVIRPMILASIFVEKALDLRNQISKALAELEKELAAASKRPDDIKRITKDMTELEKVRRTPDQLAEEHRNKLKAEAVAVLKKIHDKKMAARLAQWQTTCRFDGCEKQPRSGRERVGTKSHRRTFVFCPGHAGIRNMIAKSDYQRLKSNANLRVIA